ncbi:MAG: aspartate/glutamate racemase family protein [Alphaproteobacteria bacterium]
MTERIIVINPNSSVACTEGIDRALDPLRIEGGPGIECLTLDEGPPGIETQRDVDGVVGPLRRLVESHDNRAAAFVVACFSDPGVHALRETTAKPVFGIAESGLLAALALGDRFGVIAILAQSAARHRRFIRALGIESRFAGELAVGLRVTELADEAATFARMSTVGSRLRDETGADVMVMGCAGMARYRERLEDALGLPVVDPTQAAVAMAIAAIRLGWRGAAQRARDPAASSPRRRSARR